MPERQLAFESPAATTWQLQEKWSRAADQFKRSYLGWKAVVLLLSCLGAILAVASDQLRATPARTWAAGASALFLALVPVVMRLGTSRRALERWLRARAVSEQLKSEVYQFLVKAGPYCDSPADMPLITRRDELLEKVADLEAETVGIVAERPLPKVEDVSAYIALRVNNQIHEYYEPKAAYHRRWAVVYRRLEATLAVTGAAVATLSSLKESPIAASWVPVLTTVGTAVAAHLLAGRHEQLVPDYLATARRLTSLKERFCAANPNVSDAAASAVNVFVTDVESAISVQSEGWMAEWLRNSTGDVPNQAGIGGSRRS